jgi:hypothetical protein
MANKKIKNVTINDIFNDLLGEKNAKHFLLKIQKEYDKGVRGEVLKDFAMSTIKEIPDLNSEILKLALFVTQISTSRTHPTEPLMAPLKV